MVKMVNFMVYIFTTIRRKKGDFLSIGMKKTGKIRIVSVEIGILE